MSLILDALNRSRQDTGKLPSLDTQHYSDDAPRPGRPIALVLAVALALAVVAIVWLLLDRGDTSDQAAVSLPPALPPAASVEMVAQSSPAPAPPVVEPAPASSQPAVPQPVPAVAPDAGRDAAGGVSEAASPAKTAAPLAIAPGANRTADASVDALYRQQELAGAAAPASPVATDKAPEPSQPVASTQEESPVDIEELLAAAEEELKDARLAEHPAPFIVALSQQTKDAIPTLMYQRHDYIGSGGKSSVVINGKTLREGASTAGVKVVEVLPDSVVLSYSGTEFRLRALNSWVNL